MWMLYLVACWWFPPTSTSRGGMALELRDADGQPIVGQLVETVESTEHTDADGRVGLYYKQPDTHIHFVHEGVWYRRRYMKADEGKVVKIRLPKTEPLRVDCGLHTCDLELKWDLGEGLSGKIRTSCKSGESSIVEGAIAALPSLVCREGTNAPQTLTPTYVSGRLSLAPPQRDIDVSLSLDGASVAGCEMWIGEERTPTGGQSVKMNWKGAGVAHAECDGRPAWPTAFGALDTEVEVGWTPDGPALRLPPGMELGRLKLTWKTGELMVSATKDGSFLLPPLPADRYGVELFNGEAPGIPTGFDLPVQPGVVVARRLAKGAVVGTLELSEDRSEGILEVELQP